MASRGWLAGSGVGCGPALVSCVVRDSSGEEGALVKYSLSPLLVLSALLLFGLSFMVLDGYYVSHGSPPGLSGVRLWLSTSVFVLVLGLPGVVVWHELQHKEARE